MKTRFVIELPDPCSLDEMINEVRKQWLMLHVESELDTGVQVAKRAGMTYREYRYLLERIGVRSVHDLHLPVTPEAPQPNAETCEFCGGADKINLHHVVNRQDSPILVALCETCHKKFHFLNKLYRTPTRKAHMTKSVTSP